MQKALVSLGVLFVCLFLGANGVFGQSIQLTETITVDPAAELKDIPWSFCVTEDEIFLIPDQNAGPIKVFGKNGKVLKFIEELKGIDQEKFSNPTYCFYDQKESQLGIFDYGLRKLFILKRIGKIDFELVKRVPCKTLGYDMGLTGDGQQLVISGFLVDDEKQPFDLYSVNIENGQINQLLPSYRKYNLKSTADFNFEFHTTQKLPAIGIKAFFDIQGDDLFFVWEGALRIIKLNLRSMEKETMTFGHPTPHYIKPDALKLSPLYKKKEFKATWDEQKKMSYIRNIFATPRHVFLVYETDNGKEIPDTSRFRLQIYTPEGDYIDDVSIPGNLGLPMWFDKENYELYAFTGKSGNDKLSILKYRIQVKG